MNFDFDKVVNRRNTNSEKWDKLSNLFGNDDVLPLWVADMDFETLPEIAQSIQKELNMASLDIRQYPIHAMNQ